MTAPELPTPQWAAAVRPGDRLVVTYPRPLDMAELDDVLNGFKRHLPGVEVSILDGVSGLALVPSICRCDLVDITPVGGPPAYLRCRPNGCPVHEPEDVREAKNRARTAPPGTAEVQCVAHGKTISQHVDGYAHDCTEPPDYGHEDCCGTYGQTGMHWDTCSQRGRHRGLTADLRAAP